MNEQKDDTEKITFKDLGWVITFALLFLIYTIFIFKWGVSSGFKLNQKSFYIENYTNLEPDGLKQGINELWKKRVK